MTKLTTYCVILYCLLILTAISNAQNIEYVNSILWNGVNDTKAIGDYAYCTFDMGLGIINISNPASPQLISTLYIYDKGLGIDVCESYAYIADGESGLKIIDISDNAHPVMVGNFNTPGNAQNVIVSGNYAYIADGPTGLQIIDISNHLNPLPMGSYYTGGNACDVFVLGNIIFVADKNSGLKIINASTPSNPILVGSYNGSCTNVYVNAGFAYIAESVFRIISISNLTNPIQIGSLSLDNGLFDGSDVYVNGNYAFVTGNGLKTINISNPANPTLAASNYSGYSFSSFFKAGNFAYLSLEYSGIQILDISDPVTPIVAGRYTPFDPMGVFVVGNYVYVAGTGGLKILDATDPHNLIFLGTWDNISGAHKVFVAGRYAYLDDDAHFYIIDIIDPWHPIQVGQYDDPYGNIYGIFVSGNYAFLSKGSWGPTLNVINVSNPANPVSVGQYSGGDGAYDVFVAGSNLFLPDWDAGLEIIDISNPNNPIQIGQCGEDNLGLKDVFIAGNYAFAPCSYHASSRILDISTPSNPIVVGSYPGSPFDVFVAGNYAFSGYSGIQVIDVTNPLAPIPGESYMLSDAYYGGIFVVGDYIYDVSNSLTILRFIGNGDQTGIIAGRVTEDDGSTPIPDALVRGLLPGRELVRATTGADGRFSLPGFRFGDYDIAASKTGYLSSIAPNVTAVQGRTATAYIRLSHTPPPFCQNFSGLFCDDFEDGIITNWQSLRNDGCTWSETNGIFSTSNSSNRKWCIESVGNQTWNNYTYEGLVRGDAGVDKVLVFRIQDSDNFYAVNLRSDFPTPGIDKITFDKMVNGTYNADIVTADYPSQNGVWYDVKVECTDRIFTVFINNTQVLQYSDNDNVYFTGGTGVACWTGDAGLCDISFDYVTVTAGSTHQAILQGHVNTAQVPPQPVQGATVEIYQGGHFLTSTSTDAQGHYIFSLPVGTYVISVEKTDYETVNSSVSVPQQGTTQDFELLLSEYANLDMTLEFDPNMLLANSGNAQTDEFMIRAIFHNNENRDFSIVTASFIVDGEFEQLKTFNIDANGSKVQSHNFTIPSSWLNRTLRVKISYVNGWKATFLQTPEVSTTVSVEFLDISSPYMLNPDAYHFDNPKGNIFKKGNIMSDWMKRTDPSIMDLINFFPAILLTWNGACFGMAASSNAYYRSPSEKPVGIPTHDMDLNMPGVADGIVEYHMTSLLEIAESFFSMGGIELGDNIMDALNSQKTIALALRGDGGHAVSVYKTIKDETNYVQYATYYDNSNAGSLPLKIDRIHDSFEIPANYPIWTKARTYEDIVIKPHKAIIDWIWSLIKSAPGDIWTKGKRILNISCPIHPLITNELGQRIGFIDDTTWVNEIDSVSCVIQPNDSGDSSYYFELPRQYNYEVQFTSNNNGSAEIFSYIPVSDSEGLSSAFDSVSISSGSSGWMHLESGVSAPDTLFMDYNGDHIPDSTILPQSDIPPCRFEICHPDSGEVVYHKVPFSWHPSPDFNFGDMVRYRVYLSADSTFSAYDSSQVTADTSLIWQTLLADSTTYFWKVKAIDNYGESNYGLLPGTFLYHYSPNVIRGTVTDTAIIPIQGVNVTISGPTPKSCLSGTGGTFLIDSLRAGTYSVSFTHNDYRDTLLSGLSVISADTVVLNVALYVLPGVLTGIVTDLSGHSVENVLVKALGTAIYDSTDSIGNYLLAGLGHGTYSVQFTQPLYKDTIAQVSVSPGDTTEFNLTLSGVCNYVTGDANNSASFTGLDVTYSVRYFKGGPLPPYSCNCPPHGTWYVAGDVNGSCSFSGLDVTYMVRYFKGGAAPIACPDCPPAIFMKVK
jgi:hypothetical protein